MLIHTAEIRWFGAGAVADAVRAWFGGAGPSLRSPPRTDRYLVLPGAEGLGIKIREGRFEVKARTGGGSRVDLGDESGGSTEGWVKWIAPFTPEHDWIGDRTAVEVAKERWLRGYRLERGVEVVPLDELQTWTGCRAELSSLRMGGSEWWTIAYEASGEPDSAQAALRRVLDHVFETGAPPEPLLPTSCCSYPTLLQRFVAPARPTDGVGGP